MGIRSDVHVSQLSRRLDILEEAVDLSSRVRLIRKDFEAALAPHSFAGAGLRRYGSVHDGGYVLPEHILRCARGVVSIGVGENNDADVELANLGLVVHAWDHTVECLPQTHPNIHFHRQGLGQHDDGDLLSLRSITDLSFGSSDEGLVLLLDAEGAEWGSLGTTERSVLERYSLISVEFHKLGDTLLNPTPIFDVLSGIRELFLPVAIHANNHATSWTYDGFVLPDALEVTYVKTSLVQGPITRANGDPVLLAPCCPDMPEVELPWAEDQLSRENIQ